jgi:hypothetical protein
MISFDKNFENFENYENGSFYEKVIIIFTKIKYPLSC